MSTPSPGTSRRSRSRSCRPVVSAADVRRGDGRKMAARDLDLLVLSELLPSVDRVVVLPVDAVATADIAQLYDLDLGGHLLAAPTVVGTKGSSGFGTIHSAGLRLGPKTKARDRAAPSRLRPSCLRLRRLHDRRARPRPGSRALGRVRRGVPAVRRGVRPDPARRAALRGRPATGPSCPEHWDCVPTHTAVGRPGLVHWADPVKPWDDGYTAEQERWLAAAVIVEQPSG